MRIDEILPGTWLGDRLDALGNAAVRPIKTRTQRWGDDAIASGTGQRYIVRRIQQQMIKDWRQHTGGKPPTWDQMSEYILDTYGATAFTELQKTWRQLPNPQAPPVANPQQAQPTAGTP